jgi:D-sedoheptulose 7-phosphate isomerase
MTEIPDISSYFSHLSRTLHRLDFGIIDQIVHTVLRAYDREQMIYLFGNGGSAALASHLACDLGKGTVNTGSKRLRVLALTDNVPLMTAWANDSKYEDIFAEQLSNLVKPNDIAFAISASGNSPNVLRALKVARHARAITVGLTGFQGGKMKALCDQCMIVPCDNMQIIEDLHLCAAHAVFTAVRQSLCRQVQTIAVAAND